MISQRFGSVRQMQPEGGSYDADMDFINHDFWVTRTESGFTDYINVPRYAKGRRSLTGQPTTIWLAAPAIHLARTEDFGTENGTNSYGGVAITSLGGVLPATARFVRRDAAVYAGADAISVICSGRRRA